MAENVELEALDQLVASEGWKILTAVVAKDWGNAEGGGAFFADAVSKAVKVTGPEATDHLRQICAAQREIQRVMNWPKERIKLLKGTNGNHDAPLSRRGSL